MELTLPLWNSEGPHLGGWLPGEYLYSLASRHHHVSGNVRPWKTTRQLFGTRRTVSHDFPGYLGALSERTGQLLGSPRQIALERTLLSYYTRFPSDLCLETALALAEHGHTGVLRTRFGFQRFRGLSNHPLRSCSLCMRADTRDLGFSYWRLAHQFPGVWFCPVHDQPLQYRDQRFGNPNGRWLLPDERELTPGIPESANRRSLNFLRRVSHVAQRIAGLPSGAHFESAALARCYRSATGATGSSSSQLSSLTHHISRRLQAALSVARDVSDLRHLPSSPAPLLGYLWQISIGISVRVHPVIHTLFILSLFDSWNCFAEEYAQESNSAAE